MKQYLRVSFLPAVKLLIIIVAISPMGCNLSKPEYGSIIGSIILVNDTGDPSNDPSDNSGISVALYAPATIDTTFERINSSYPTIGTEINQATEFDHRSRTPLYTTTTTSSGEYTIKDIDPGTYNIVAYKQGWGWCYQYIVNIPGSEEVSLGTNTLYHELILNPYYSDTMVLLSNHHYLVSSDTYFSGGIEFQENAWLRTADHTNVTINSHYICPIEGYAFVVQEEGQALSTSVYSVNTATDISVHNMIYKQLYCALKFTSTSGNVTNSRFTDCSSAVQARYCDLSISNITCSDSQNGSDGIASEFSNIEVNNVVVSGFIYALSIRSDSQGTVQNSYLKSRTPIRLDTNTSSNISYCCLESSNYCIYAKQSSLFDIERNNFYGNGGVYLLGISMAPGNLISFNNFFCSSYYLDASPLQNPLYASYILNATRNYFHRTNLDQINQYIFDANDLTDPNVWTLTFNISQYVGTPIPDCGIQ